MLESLFIPQLAIFLPHWSLVQSPIIYPFSQTLPCFFLSEIFMSIRSSTSYRWGSCVCTEIRCQPSPWLDTRPVLWPSVCQEWYYPECWALSYCHIRLFYPWIASKRKKTPSQPISFMQQFPVSKSIGGKERVAVSHGIWQLSVEAQHTPLSKKMWDLAWNKHNFFGAVVELKNWRKKTYWFF